MGISALITLLVVHQLDPLLTSAIFVQSLVWLSWGQILLAFSCSGAPARLADIDGIRTLWHLRGLPANASPSAVFVGYFQLLLWPLLALGGGLALAHAALSDSLHQFSLRVIQVPFTLAYFTLLGAVLARLCQLAQVRGGRHGRLLFLGGILLPYLASLFWPHFPSVPSVFGWLLDTELLRAGA